MAEAVLQGMAVRGNVAQGSVVRALGALGLAVARGAGATFRAVSWVIQVAEPMAQGGFGGGANMAPAARGHLPV